jgi:hypothetical protein
MKQHLIWFLPLLIVACGGESSDRGQNDYASGPLPTAAAVQTQAVIQQEATQESVVSETIVGRELTSDGAVDPAARSEQFLRGEEVHLAVRIEPSSAAPNEVRVTWYGPNDSLIAQDAQTLPRTSRFISFSSGKTTNWDPGSYRAEVWLGTHKLAEERFALAAADDAESSTPMNGS